MLLYWYKTLVDYLVFPLSSYSETNSRAFFIKLKICNFVPLRGQSLTMSGFQLLLALSSTFTLLNVVNTVLASHPAIEESALSSWSEHIASGTQRTLVAASLKDGIASRATSWQLRNTHYFYYVDGLCHMHGTVVQKLILCGRDTHWHI